MNNLTTKFLLLSTLITAMLFSPGQSKAVDDAAEELESPSLRKALFDIEENMSGLQSVRSDFRQTKELAIFEREMVITGEMALEEPGRMAWRVHEPVKYTMVIKDAQMTHWDEDTDSVQSMSMDDDPAIQSVFEQLTTWFSGKYHSFIEEYRIELKQEGPYIVVFTPRQQSVFADLIDEIEVKFREDARYIEKLTILEADGDRSVIEFKNTSLDVELPPETWEVRPR